MPDPPAESLFTRFVLENNYPLAGALIVVGVLIGWLALRDGRLERLRIAAIPIVLGVAVLATGLFVVTAGEHARSLIRALIDDVVAADLVGTMAHFSDDARLRFGSTRNPARDIGGIRSAFDRLNSRYPIESNRITELRAYTTSPETATVHLGNWTEAGFGPVRSQCVVEVVRTSGGTWKVDEVTVLSVNGQKPRW